MKARRAASGFSSAFAAFAAIAALAGGPGCGGARGGLGEPPVPALSSSTRAQVELRRLLQRFAAAPRDERAALQAELVAFRRRYAGDPLNRLVDAHLAWIALEKGDLARAESLAAELRAGLPGVPRDIAQVVQGAALRRRGRPREAFTTLRPLVGKLIDAYARALLNVEVVTAATEAGRFTEAIKLADVWLREIGDEERAAARAGIQALLPRMPPEVLSRALRERQAAQQEDIPESELLLRTLLAERLAAVALEKKDVRLAQELLATSGPLLGAQGDRIAQLAAGATTARVGVATVGLLISARTPEARRRAVEAAAGVSFGLGLLSANGGDAGKVRVVSRDDAGEAGEDRTLEALSALTAEGAAVLITGFDRGQSTATAAFARAQEIPVLLLHPPDPGAVSGPFVFVLGEEPTRVGEALVAALAAEGARKVALVGDAETVGAASKPAGVTVALSCDGPMDERTLRLAGAQGLALNGDDGCAERAMEAMGALRLRAAFGLEALGAAPAGSLVAGAGRVPFAGAARDADAAAWLKAQVEPPSWWAALGRDAAVLAQAGLARLPAKGTEDPAEVKARRREVTEGVAQASAALWTTEARGFEGKQRMGREIRVGEAKGASGP